jgi:hypothetical protein
MPVGSNRDRDGRHRPGNQALLFAPDLVPEARFGKAVRIGGERGFQPDSLAMKTLFPRIVPVVHPLPSRSKMSPQGAVAASRFSFGPG